VFLLNGQNGCIVSKNSVHYIPTFKHMLAITKEAEWIRLNFIMSMLKYRGFGDETGYWDLRLDSVSLTSALEAVSER
jgi:pyrimidine oxygenase